MSGWEIALSVAVGVAFVIAVGVIIRNKLKGKSCCGDCSCCSGCNAKKKSGDPAQKCPYCDQSNLENK